MFDYMLDLPVKVKFGSGALDELGILTAGFGKKAFLLHDPFLRGSKMLERIRDMLAENGADAVCFDDVEPNPRVSTIDAAAMTCWKEGCDVVIGIGGGSAIDSAKATCIVAKNGGSAWDYTEREGVSAHSTEKGRLPLIAIPTTSGTGTEVTPFAVVNNQSLHTKAAISLPECYADVAVVDPVIMASMPPSVTANTGIDAFAHALEAYISDIPTPLTDALCLNAIRLFAENIEKCVQHGDDLNARANMALCSLYAGIGIGHASTTLPHAIAQALGGYKDVPHGMAITSCILNVIRWTLPCAQEKLARVAEIFDPTLAGRPESERAASLPDILDDLFLRLMGGKRVTMGSLGLAAQEAETVAKLVMECYYGDCLLHPKQPQREDILALIRQSI